MRLCLGFRFAIQGDLRFISHHDTLRMFERALVRAGLPVKRSEGFNPKPRLSLPLPRSVGVASLDELLIVELSEPLDAETAARRMASQLPAGITLLTVEPISGQAPRLAAAVSYELPIEPSECETVRVNVERLLAQTARVIQRTDAKTGRQREIDVRPYIREIALVESRLAWTQEVTGQGTVRPAEVMEAIGIDPRGALHRLVRTHVEYPVKSDTSTIGRMPADDPLATNSLEGIAT